MDINLCTDLVLFGRDANSDLWEKKGRNKSGRVCFAQAIQNT